MAKVNIQTVTLSGYKATVDGALYLVLGTWDSYGTEQLQINAGPEWDGLVIKATFVTPAGATPVVVPDGGLIDVPPEATAQALTAGSPGMIVFSGVTSGVQRISCNLLYLVRDHAPIDGTAPEPTPDQWAQFVAQVKADADRAEQAAGDAADSATTAAKSAEAADESAKKAEQAGADIGEAKDAALEAIQQAQDTGVQAVEGETAAGVQAVQQAHQAALDDIATERETALEAVQTEGDKRQTAIAGAGAAALEAIGQVEQTAIGQVQQAGAAQVDSVNAAGNAQLDKINAANALVPTPTQADAGKAIVVKPDGSGYELGEVQTDAYTKAESDARYAPIESAIKVSGSGTGLVSLSPTVGWYQQGLALYGRSWQDGTPNVETEVPIQSVGQNGTVDVTVCGANFLAIPEEDYSRIGVTISNKNGVQVISGTSLGQGDIRLVYTIIPISGTYKFKSAGVVTSRVFQNGTIRGSNPNLDITLQCAAGDQIAMSIYATNGTTYNSEKVYQWITAGDADVPFTPYVEPQKLTIPTTDGLPGIPVNRGGNWTDENGQAWVSDVIDMAAGTKAQNCAKYFPQNDIFSISIGGTGENAQTIFVRKQIQNGTTPHTLAVMCNFLPKVDSGIWNSDEECYYYGRDGYLDFRILKSRLSSADVAGVKAFCASIGAEFLYALYEPIVTPLAAETVAAYKALQSYPGTTNILAPDCGIEASALAEPNQWVQQQIQSAITQAVTQAVALTGGNA